MEGKRIKEGAFVIDLNTEPPEDRMKRPPDSIVIDQYRGFVTIGFGREFMTAITPAVARELRKQLGKGIAKAEKGRLREQASVEARKRKAYEEAKAERKRILDRQKKENGENL